MSRTRHFTLVLSSFVSLINLFRFGALAKVARQSLAIGLIVLLVSNHSLAAPGIVMATADSG